MFCCRWLIGRVRHTITKPLALGDPGLLRIIIPVIKKGKKDPCPGKEKILMIINYRSNKIHVCNYTHEF